MEQPLDPKAVPIQAIPAFAKIQEPAPAVAVEQYPQYAQLVQFQNLQALGSYSQNSLFTPYSASFVQIYQ